MLIDQVKTLAVRFIPGWLQIKRALDALTTKSFFAPAISQVSIISLSFVPQASIPEWSLYLSYLTLGSLLIVERLVNFLFPENLVSVGSQYFIDLEKLLKSIHTSLAESKRIEELWKEIMIERLDHIEINDEARAITAKATRKTQIFPELAAYKPYFIDYCDPSRQRALNLYCPFARFLCSTLLLVASLSFVSALALVIHRFIST